MNKQRRKLIKDAIGHIYEAMEILESAKEDERDCLENMPENLQSSERYEQMENNVEVLDASYDALLDMTTELEEMLDE